MLLHLMHVKNGQISVTVKC